MRLRLLSPAPSMTRRDKIAGCVHLLEFAVAAVGLLGWAWWVTHKDDPRPA